MKKEAQTTRFALLVNGENMAYTFEAKIRYSECDQDEYLTPLGIINYLQDCSTFQSESLGVGIQYLKEQKRAWFLNSWQIYFDRYPHFGEKIEIGTYAHGFKGIYGYRHFFIRDEKGEFAVRADSVWFLCDTERMLPVKATEEFTKPYEGMTGPELHMGELSRKIVLPKELSSVGQQKHLEQGVKETLSNDGGTEAEEKKKGRLLLPAGVRAGENITVHKHHLDTNRHVNNAQYIDMAIDAAGIERPRFVQAEYKKAAVLHDVITPYLMEEGDGTTLVNLAMEDGKPYALLRLKA